MRVFFLLMAIVSPFFTQAQDEPVIVYDDDQVTVSYLLLEVKKKKAMIPEWRLLIENKSKNYIELNFEVLMKFDMELAEATEVSAYCIAPGKIMKGRIKGLFYNPENLNYAQMSSDDFEFLIEELVIKTLKNCK